jgi:hypothetical protein
MQPVSFEPLFMVQADAITEDVLDCVYFAFWKKWLTRHGNVGQTSSRDFSLNLEKQYSHGSVVLRARGKWLGIASFETFIARIRWFFSPVNRF